MTQTGRLENMHELGGTETVLRMQDPQTEGFATEAQ